MTQQRLLAGSPWRIRLIALFEALKGLLALALGFGLVASFGESLSEAAQELVLGLHLDPSKRLPGADRRLVPAAAPVRSAAEVGGAAGIPVAAVAEVHRPVLELGRGVVCG